MKIGILTLKLHNNYGGILQAYALQKYLAKLGHEAILIDRRLNTFTTDINDIKLRVKTRIDKKNFPTAEESKRISEHTAYFTDKYIQPKTETIDSNRKLRKLNKSGFDVIVVGSDQVWRLDYARGARKNYFLDFLHNPKIRKISYAASFGTDTWTYPPNITRQLIPLLQKFDSISVREESGITICNDVFGVNAEQHIDPTLLLDKNDYIDLIKNENEPESEGDVFAYVLDLNQEKVNYIESVANKIGGKAKIIRIKKKRQGGTIEEWIFPKVTEWLRGFYDAKIVITDSFHGCAFSILFNKPFITFGNKKRGLARFNSLLDNFGLKDRLILSTESIHQELINQQINYDDVNCLLEKERKRSREYLINNLK